MVCHSSTNNRINISFLKQKISLVALSQQSKVNKPAMPHVSTELRLKTKTTRKQRNVIDLSRVIPVKIAKYDIIYIFIFFCSIINMLKVQVILIILVFYFVTSCVFHFTKQKTKTKKKSIKSQVLLLSILGADSQYFGYLQEQQKGLSETFQERVPT